MTRAIKSASRIAAVTFSLSTDNLICAKSETYINFNCSPHPPSPPPLHAPPRHCYLSPEISGLVGETVTLRLIWLRAGGATAVQGDRRTEFGDNKRSPNTKRCLYVCVREQFRGSVIRWPNTLTHHR